MIDYIDAHSGSDGEVRLILPPELANQDFRFYLPNVDDKSPLEVRMTKRKKREELLEMLRQTQGAITDPTFMRQPQIDLGPPPNFDE